jgi:hypothetical protein
MTELRKKLIGQLADIKAHKRTVVFESLFSRKLKISSDGFDWLVNDKDIFTNVKGLTDIMLHEETVYICPCNEKKGGD